MQFGNKLKQLRENKNLKQADLAALLNVSPSTVAMYEQNNRKPDHDTLVSIADFFEVSADYLLGRTDDIVCYENENKNIFKTAIGVRIRKLREKFDISQKDLAKELCIDKGVMNRIELGTRPVRDDELFRLANYFKVSADYLIGISSLKNYELDSSVSTIVNKIELLSDNDKYTINKFLDFMIDNSDK